MRVTAHTVPGTGPGVPSCLNCDFTICSVPEEEKKFIRQRGGRREVLGREERAQVPR